MRIRKIVRYSAVPLILLLGVAAMQALGSTRKESNKREAGPEVRAVETQRLVFGDVALTVEGNGVVEPERTLNIVSEVPGRVLFAKNDLKDGTYAREGEVLVRIDSRDVGNQLHALRSDFLNAVASVLPELQLNDPEIWRKWFDYFNSLDASEKVPELPEITSAQEKIKVSSRNIISKYYEIRNQEIRLSKHTIRAPFDGYISSEGVIENSFVTQGQPLFTLSDANNLVVAVPLLVAESQSIDFSRTPRATIYPEAGAAVSKRGRVARKQTRLDRNSQTLNVYVSLRNPELDPHFLPGNYVHVQIEGRTLRDVAAIPRHLLDQEGRVYTMEEDGTLGREQFEPVAYQGDMAIVRSRTNEEPIIVTTILQKPLVGMEIRSINMPELSDDQELADSPQTDRPAATDGSISTSRDG